MKVRNILRRTLTDVIDTDISIIRKGNVLAVISTIEKQYGVELPSEYKEFLTDYAPCFIKDDFMYSPDTDTPLMDENGFDAVGVIFGVADEPYSISSIIKTYYDQLDNDVIPIAEGNPGDIICLGLRAHNRGKVYYWHHENELEYVDGSQIYYLIANSFVEFILKLTKSSRGTDFNVDNVRVRFDSDLFDD